MVRRFVSTKKPCRTILPPEKFGRPIFDTCLMCEVITPGSRESYPVFELERKYADEVGITEPARSPKYAEYSRQIDAFRNGNGGADLRGTPLTAWPAVSVAIAATCQHAGIFTVEALAALPESRFSAVGPGARSLVERAKAFIAAAEGNAPTEALAAGELALSTRKKGPVIMSYVLPAGMKSAAAFGGLPGRNPGIVPPNLNGNSNVLPPPPAAAAPAPPHIMAAPDAGLGTGPGAPSAAPGTQNFIGDMPPPVAAPAPAAVPTGQFPLNPAAAGGPPPAAGGVPGLQGVPGGVVSSIATALQDGGGGILAAIAPA
jgi:hypothetical protein